MSFRIEEPRTLGAEDIFLWWCKQKIRKKRHLKIKYISSHAKETILVSKNGDELKWLVKHMEVLEEQILKLEKEEKKKVYYTKKIEEIYHMKREVHESKDRIEHLRQVNLSTEHIIMTDKKFKDILYQFNDRARDIMIKEAGVINMKQYLGYLYIQKIPRNHPNFISKGATTVNWNESNKYKQELIDKGVQIKNKDHPNGKNWFVYYTDEFFLRVAWTKKSGACRVKNHAYYGFYPCKGEKGFRKQLAHTNHNNPILHRKYVSRKIYYPSLPNRQSA